MFNINNQTNRSHIDIIPDISPLAVDISWVIETMNNASNSCKLMVLR
jgi:hypothetical protein